MKFPEDKENFGRSRVLVDPYTGKVLLADSSRLAPPATKIIRLMRPLHTGDIFGWSSRIIMFLASLAIVLQVITGVIMWIVRSFKGKSTPSSKRREAPVAVGAD